jgi:hypothetical protein
MFTAFTSAFALERDHEIESAATRHAERSADVPKVPGTFGTNGFASSPGSVRLRFSWPSDAKALADLGRLDADGAFAARLSALGAGGGVLVAESGGEIVAALALDDERVVADPFRPSAGAAELLRVRAEQLRRRRPRRWIPVFAPRPHLHH